MVPTPQQFHLSFCFGLNWSWWRAPRPHADATVTLNLGQVIFATSTHRVATPSFFLHWHLWQQTLTPPPRDAGCDSLCVTLEAYMAEGWGASGPRQGPSVSPLSHRQLCVCARSWMNYHLSHTMTTSFLFFSFSLHATLPLLFHRWPTDRTAEDIRADDQIARRTPAKHNTRKKNKKKKKRLHWRTREMTHSDTSTPPQRHSQRPPTPLLPLWSFTSSFLLQNKGKKRPKNAPKITDPR